VTARPRPRPAGDTAFPPVAALAACWAALLFAAFRPGYMSVDSVVQYGQGLAGAFSNQHPPLGSIVFGLSGRLTGSPAGALALQLALLGGGFALLAGPAPRARRAAAVLLTAAFLAAPSTWATAVVLWKDVLLAGVLLLACAAMRARRTAAALALLVLAALLRHDGLAAAAPLAVGAAWTSPALRSRARRVAAAGAAIAAMLVLPGAVERAVGARDVWPVGQLYVYDLAGIAVRAPEAFAGSSLSREVTLDDVRARYTPFTGGPLMFARRPGDRVIPFHELSQHRELAGEWLRAVVAHPRAYLAHRLAVLAATLGAHRGPAFGPYHVGVDPNPWGLRAEPGRLARALARVRDAARDGPLFRGWFWVALCAAGVALLARRAAADAVPLWIAASGLSYALAHLAFAVAAEFRYVYWTALAPFAAAAAALAFRSTAHCESPPTISTRRSANPGTVRRSTR
jgi:hypothetical protein